MGAKLAADVDVDEAGDVAGAVWVVVPAGGAPGVGGVGGGEGVAIGAGGLEEGAAAGGGGGPLQGAAAGAQHGGWEGGGWGWFGGVGRAAAAGASLRCCKDSIRARMNPYDKATSHEAI